MAQRNQYLRDIVEETCDIKQWVDEMFVQAINVCWPEDAARVVGVKRTLTKAEARRASLMSLEVPSPSLLLQQQRQQQLGEDDDKDKDKTAPNDTIALLRILSSVVH